MASGFKKALFQNPAFSGMAALQGAAGGRAGKQSGGMETGFAFGNLAGRF